MPKAYISIAERDRARLFRQLKMEIRDGIYRKISYEELALKSGYSKSLVQKMMRQPEQLRVEDMCKILNAAGLTLTVNIDVRE